MERFVPLKEMPGTRVIFETDLCKDVDDVGAVAFLCDAVKRFGAELLGISVNVMGEKEAPAADALLQRFAFPQLPICVWQGELLAGGNASAYVDHLSGVLSAERVASLQPCDPIAFYQKLLQTVPDDSVVILSVGFFCNLNAAYAALPELFTRKVRAVVAMAGTFGAKPGYKEYNIRMMPGDAHAFLSNYPGQIVYIPSETGEKVMTDLRDWPADPTDPVYESYRIYTGDTLLRPSWDLITVEFAFEGENEYYTLSEWGRAEITPDAQSSFREDPQGKHAYVMLKRSPEETGRHISEKLYRICRG